MANLDGGPAFPIVDEFVSDQGVCAVTPAYGRGMSLRDYFAAKAMQSLLSDMADGGRFRDQGVALRTADFAYQVADAMLKAREATHG